MKKYLTILIIVLMLSLSFTIGTTSSETINAASDTSTTIYVSVDFDNSTPGWNTTHFNRIQDGINAANTNDTVYVYSGTYYENNIVINKAINLQGENKDTTIVDASGNEEVLWVSGGTTGVSISHLTIKNSGYLGSGITFSSNTRNNIAKENKIISNYHGIRCVLSNDNEISNNIISSNDIGIVITTASNSNLIINNELSLNGKGIDAEDGASTISNNLFSQNTIALSIGSAVNTVLNNLITNNNVGMYFTKGGYSNHISFNYLSGNSLYGIQTNFPPAPTYAGLQNSFSNNNFMDKNNTYLYNNQNGWDSNYWSNWKGLDYPDNGEFLINLINTLYERPFLSKIIDKIIDSKGYPTPPYPGPFYKIPGAPEGLSSQFPTYYNIDWNPAREPYDINIGYAD